VSLATLIAYYSSKEEARNAFQTVACPGCHRAALLHKGPDGTIRNADPLRWRHALELLLVAVICAEVAGLSVLMLRWLLPLPGWSLPAPLSLILAAPAVAALAVQLLQRRLRCHVDPLVLRDHARRLLPGETLLMLQAPVDSLARPMALLREQPDAPALFVLHPQRERRAESRVPEVKLSPAQIQEHAQRHAGEQRVDRRTGRSAVLLKRLRESRHWVRRICADLGAASRLEQKATPAADWILDNEYVLEGNVRDVLVNLPGSFYRQLPILASDPYRGLPCIYGLAKDLVSHSELRLDREGVVSFIEAYQSVRLLSIGELWAIPQMLRIALVESIQSLAVTALANLRERQLADFWASRLVAANRRDANQLFGILAELAAAEPCPTPYFAAQLVGLLYDEAAALAPVQNWLERTHKGPLNELTSREQHRQTREQMSCGNAFTSLRQLALLDWREIFERLSQVDQVLRRDPAGTYGAMDFATRDRCRRAIEVLAGGRADKELELARRAIALAAGTRDTLEGDDRLHYVGSWLEGAGRAELVRQAGAREKPRYRILSWIYRHHAPLYGLGIGASCAALVTLFAQFALPAGLPGAHWLRPGLLLVALVPLSQLAIEVVNYLVTRFLPPRPLPKMDFEAAGIPDAFRTLVVVPMLLVNEATLAAEVERLEIRYLANKDDNLLFALFSDFTDSASLSREDDARLIGCAVAGLAELNARHPGERFFLFHRERTWSESEQKFIGWERKRGKLEELNGLIDGTRDEGAARLVYLGDPERLADVRFVITLDSDTQLPHGTARRMVETLAHPLNQPRFNPAGELTAGYSIIQPRVSPTLTSTSVSLFSRLFSDAVGIDPYTQAVSDVYQDLSGEGSYHGKGIYDVRAFNRLLSGRFPEAWVLSHDLIEGAHVRVGLASDIELYDEFPQGYQGYASRAHRWIRGDWQIAGWILPSVPQALGGRGSNRLSLLNRWKILDNLRRSLLPATSLALLIACWFTSPGAGALAALVVGMQLLFHPLAQPFTMATTGKGLKYFSPAQLGHDLLRALADAALLPHQAAVALDAIARVAYRRLISGRDLLEWTAQASQANAARRQPLFVASLALGSLFSVVAGGALWCCRPASLPQALPWLVLWFASPLLGWLLNLRPGQGHAARPLAPADQRFLREIARRTWRYFSVFIGPDTCWLPPDNYQQAHQNRSALRTSPTNIGLWLTSALGAHDMGYLTLDQLLDRLTRSLESIGRLELYRGNLLNWYDIRTLAPLEPRYVSGVDSGNLLGALVALEQGLGELGQGRLLDERAFAGLLDTGIILKQMMGQERLGGFDPGFLDQMLSQWAAPPVSLIDQLHLLEQMQVNFRIPLVPGGEASWAGEMEDQVAAWLDNAQRYLGWVGVLAEKGEPELAPLGTAALEAVRGDLSRAPSLVELAEGRVESIRLIEAYRKAQPPVGPLLEWSDRVLAAFANARWLAGETLAALERLSTAVRELARGMDLQFLYDPKQKLFAIGYNASSGRLDHSSYDLLASEARLASFLAIARGEVPMEHWFSLGRPYGAVGQKRVLLSWTGTMFEYLMPLIFQKSYANSLLDRAAREAVAVQIDYGHKLGVPWGISESAFADLDLEKTYQYHAFGVPALGLKRAVEEKLVVAPYATLLALSLAPQATVQNLRRLAGLGMLSDFGYYEAVDFSRQTQRQGARGVIVEAYMAHHQGMAFLSLVNYLTGDPFPRRFHGDPRVRAFEALLQERIPTLPPLQLISARPLEPQLLAGDLAAPAATSFTTPHTVTPRSLLLSNGRYGVMVTNSGAGYSQWGGLEITRWRSDPTLDLGGIFCYLHEVDTDRVWSSTYQPVCGEVQGYGVDFTLDRAVFRRADDGIHTETEIIVSPEDDVEVRRVTLTNRSSRTRRIDLTSYVELSMAPHNADRQHPAFNKLFIETEALPGQRALVAHRRARSAGEAPFYVAHALTLERSEAEAAPLKAWQFETDRGRFIGRGRTLANPMGAAGELGNSQGYVLDPMLGMRHGITLEPGQSVRVSLVLVAGASRAEVLLLLDKYSDPHAGERAQDFAWRAAQQQLQVLRVQPDEARRFQQLASHLLFPNRALRAPAERLEENRLGQAGLWPYAISGDFPMVLVTVGEARELSLVRQMLQAHTYWRLHGLATDLVILNEEEASYQRPLKERLEQLVQNHALSRASDLPGGIFLVCAAQIPEQDLKLFKAAASIVLVAARGTLPQQLGLPAESSEAPQALIKKRDPRDPSGPLPFRELDYFNSLGGFTPDGREYAIYLGPGSNTPAPWVNVIANPNFGTLVSETGSGFTWFGNSQRNRLTGWSNDPVLDPASEALYLRDEESGAVWSPTAAPIREASAYRARHGAGYSVFEHNSNGIDQELTVCVPVDGEGGQPVKLQRLRLKNTTARKRRISLTYYVELTLGENRETTQMHLVSNWDEDAGALLARNHYHPEYAERVAFVALTPRPESYGGDRAAFIGRNRTLSDPAGMELGSLSGRVGAGLDPCAVLRLTLELDSGEEREVTCLLGQAGTTQEARALVLRYREDASFEAALEVTRAWWDELLGTVQVETPERATDLLVNRWLQYQSLSCRIWGRSALYQSGGAFGFRDQLQDVMSFLQARPELARQQILLAASRQFKEGDVQHWWHEPAGAGIRSRISDDLLWLPYVTAQYVRATGDRAILLEEVPFLNAPPLADNQHEVFSSPEVTFERATVFEHCRRTLARGLTVGPHGLPLMGTGDWNDGMNLVGAQGKGESVWLGWFLCDCLQGMAELAGLLGENEQERAYRENRYALVQRMETAGWDGEWYLRGTFDDGSLLGSAQNREARIDSLPQSWAWLSGAADRQRAERALESAWQHLVRVDEGLVLLFEPPFDTSLPSPGYIKGYPPGVRENGGQYTHAALWMAMALARKGDGDRAAQLLRILNPIEHARDAEGVWCYQVEPYVVAADVYRLPGKVGQGGWSWYTGSAAWMYRAWVEEVLGLEVRGEELRVHPVIPAAWPGFSMRYRHGEALYAIRVENPDGCQRGVAWVELDGRRLAGGAIPLERGLVQHQVVIRMGEGGDGVS
jgi:cyclic beta-1,2-glucan synthetase